MGKGLTVKDSNFHDLTGGISLQANDHVTIKNNNFRDHYRDTISGRMASDLIIEGNHFTAFIGPAEHLDVVQLIGGMNNVKISKNVIERGTTRFGDPGTPAQGFFLTEGNYQNIDIRGNAMRGTAWHGITISRPISGYVEDNFVQGDGIPYGSVGIITPWIRQDNAGDAFEIQNNIATAYNGWPSDCCGNQLISNPAAGDRSAFEAFLSSHGLHASAASPSYAAEEDPAQQMAAVGTLLPLLEMLYQKLIEFLRSLL